MPIYNHYEYMQSVARRLRPLADLGNHFFYSPGWNSLVALFSRLNDMNYPCLIADYDESSQMIDRGSDNILERTYYNAYIVDGAQPGDVESVIKAKANARLLAEQVVGRMVEDQRVGYPGLEHLEIDSIRIDTLGVVGDSGWGVAISFSVLRPTVARIDRSLWL